MNCSKNHTTKSTCSSKKSISPVKSLKDLINEYKKSGIFMKIGEYIVLSQKRCSGILVIALVTLLCQMFYQMLNGMIFLMR